MKILQKGIMPDSTKIQIEDWSEDYSFRPFAGTIGAYPVAKNDIDGSFKPKKGKSFRMGLNFDNQEQAEEAYSSLIEGKAGLLDYIRYIDAKDYVQAI